MYQSAVSKLFFGYWKIGFLTSVFLLGFVCIRVYVTWQYEEQLYNLRSYFTKTPRARTFAISRRNSLFDRDGERFARRSSMFKREKLRTCASAVPLVFDKDETFSPTRRPFKADDESTVDNTPLQRINKKTSVAFAPEVQNPYLFGKRPAMPVKVPRLEKLLPKPIEAVEKAADANVVTIQSMIFCVEGLPLISLLSVLTFGFLCCALWRFYGIATIPVVLLSFVGIANLFELGKLLPSFSLRVLSTLISFLVLGSVRLASDSVFDDGNVGSRLLGIIPSLGKRHVCVACLLVLGTSAVTTFYLAITSLMTIQTSMKNFVLPCPKDIITTLQSFSLWMHKLR